MNAYKKSYSIFLLCTTLAAGDYALRALVRVALCLRGMPSMYDMARRYGGTGEVRRGSSHVAGEFS